MITKLHTPLRREIHLDREAWIVTIGPTGLKLTRKGRRKGLELDWKALVSGDAALAAALNASLRGSPRPAPVGRQRQALAPSRRRRARSTTRRRA